MKGLRYFSQIIAAIFIAFTILMLIPAHALASEPSVHITEWQMKWINEADSTDSDQSVLSVNNDSSSDWLTINPVENMPQKPSHITQAVLRIQLPELKWNIPAALINNLYAKDVTISIDNTVIYESKRNYPYNKNEILLPLHHSYSNKTLTMYINTETNDLGLADSVELGEYQNLNKRYMKKDISDVILSASLIILAFGMFFSVVSLRVSYLVGWNSLCIAIFSFGLMILTYSKFVHNAFGDWGKLAYYLFDIASTIIIPALFIFFEKIFGPGPYRVITLFRKAQVMISVISIAWLFLILIFPLPKEPYMIVVSLIFGLSVVLGNILLVYTLFVLSLQGNKEARIIAIGFSIFASLVIIEIIIFYSQTTSYNMFLWKWGMLCFLASLVIISTRRIVQNYEQVVKYSKQLELLNNDLQRSEKMEIISQLAASVAHEVRNPLQVTRGFLQLLGSRERNEREKGYMLLAIEELDRASDIITDFLTFAKPQIESVTILDVSSELKQLEGIILPLATLHGGVLIIEMEPDIYIHGNSSKLKQALINIVKNSIEALDTEGTVIIKSYKDNDNNKAVLMIKDDGEGMSEADLKRLGEPYYSKKTKGTGLGLMVTYRILEAMQGEIVFLSERGKGTEAIINFPLINKNTNP